MHLPDPLAFHLPKITPPEKKGGGGWSFNPCPGHLSPGEMPWDNYIG